MPRRSDTALHAGTLIKREGNFVGQARSQQPCKTAIRVFRLHTGGASVEICLTLANTIRIPIKSAHFAVHVMFNY